MINNYIFTVTAGRSGQATLYDILQRYSEKCLSSFEAPRINTIFPGTIGDIEKRIRRKTLDVCNMYTIIKVVYVTAAAVRR